MQTFVLWHMHTLAISHCRAPTLHCTHLIQSLVRIQYVRSVHVCGDVEAYGRFFSLPLSFCAKCKLNGIGKRLPLANKHGMFRFIVGAFVVGAVGGGECRWWRIVC